MIAEMKPVDGDLEFTYTSNGNAVAIFVKTQIPGLWTPKVELKKIYLDSINIISIKLEIPQFDDVPIEQGCYVLVGGTSVLELAEMVRERLGLGEESLLSFACDGKEISDGCIMSDIYKEHISGDGFLDMECTIGFA